MKVFKNCSMVESFKLTFSNENSVNRDSKDSTQHFDFKGDFHLYNYGMKKKVKMPF